MIIKDEMQETFLRLGFSQMVAIMLVEGEEIAFPQIPMSLFNEIIIVTCD